MTTAGFLSIQQQLPELSERQRVAMAAALYRLKQESPAWEREMSRRMAEMDEGRKVSLSKLMPRSRHA